MTQIDLSDVTFTIPVKVESEQRLRNLETVINYLLKYFETSILVGEESKIFKLEHLKSKVKVIHYPVEYDWVHRTKILNALAKESKTPIISNYDTDVLFPVEQYVNAVNLIRSEDYDLVYPYAGPFLNMPENFCKEVQQNLSLNSVDPKACNCLHPSSVGGAVFWDRGAFFKCGMENEYFKSWGYEDNERLNRSQKLGYRVKRVAGNLFHLDHFRGKDSGFSNPFADQNKAEYIKVANMDKEHLKNYILTWPWTDK